MPIIPGIDGIMPDIIDGIMFDIIVAIGFIGICMAGIIARVLLMKTGVGRGPRSVYWISNRRRERNSHEKDDRSGAGYLQSLTNNQ